MRMAPLAQQLECIILEVVVRVAKDAGLPCVLVAVVDDTKQKSMRENQVERHAEL